MGFSPSLFSEMREFLCEKLSFKWSTHTEKKFGTKMENSNFAKTDMSTC